MPKEWVWFEGFRVTFQSHDVVAKTVIGLLATGREQIPEAELRMPAYGDVLLRPGPPFPFFTGLLRELVGTGLCLMEFYSARPSLDALLRVRAKGYMSVVAERHRQRGLVDARHLPGPEHLRIIIVGMGQALYTRAKVWRDLVWHHTQPGQWWLEGPPRVFFIDLVRLPLTSLTCWLHLAGDSPYTRETLDFIWQQGPEAERILVQLAEELPHMQLQSTEENRPSGRRLLSALEEWNARMKGLERGRSEGRMEGRMEGKRELLQRLFQEGLLPADRFQTELVALEREQQSLTRPAPSV